MSQKQTSSTTVLVVDDEPMALDNIEGFLFPDGYTIHFASSGVDALARLDDLHPDVILLDVMMPEMDGFEVCQIIKANDTWRHVPVILVTALSDKEDLARGLAAGADDFINKPVSGVELRARVKSMLRIKKQYDELQSVLRLRDDMAEMIVHDMRSPLSTIIGFCQLFMLKHQGKQDLTDLERVIGQAQRLNSYLNDLLLLAKMDSGQLLITRTSVNINKIAHKIKENYITTAQSRNITLSLNLPTESPSLSLDRNLIERVIDNLVSNAIKYSLSQGEVRLEVEYTQAKFPQTQLRLRVIDQGMGIPEKKRHRIFEKFETIGSERNDISQVGLGLTFCKMVVEAHGGQIFVKANQPNGSIFTLEV